MVKCYAGVDPGSTGCVFVTSEKGERLYSLTTMSVKDIFEELYTACDYNVFSVYMEAVHGRRGDHPNKAFAFGRNTGKMDAIFEILGLKVNYVEPPMWKRFHGLGGIKDYDEGKRRAKEKAQALYPNVKVTLTNADSILIARYGLAQEMDV